MEVAALCAGCPIGDMVIQIAEKLPDAKVGAIQQVVESRLHALDQFRRFSYGVAGVVVFIGSLIVFVNMMGASTRGRRRSASSAPSASERATLCGSSSLRRPW